MFWFALAFCAGAATVHMLPALPPLAWLLPIALAALLVRRRRPPMAAFCLGMVWTTLLVATQVADSWPCGRDREEITLTGVVTAPATRRDGRTDFDLDVAESPAQGPLPDRVRLSWYEPTATPEPGQRWRVSARLRCPRGLANPGGADRELDLLRQRIGATGQVVTHAPVELLRDESSRHPIERLRARIAADIAAALPAGPSVSVLQGLAVGVRGNISTALWDAFAATGIAHLMAISGLHVTGCALFVLLLLRGLWRLPWLGRVPARTAIEVTVVVCATAGYALLAGASLPALRTLAMVGIVALQRLLRRTLPVHQTLALAALLMVGSDPLGLTSAGFWLSFVATAALLTIIEGGTGWRARIVAFTRAQAAITVLLMPVLAVAFGRLSLIAPLINAMAIPVFSFMLLPAELLATLLDGLAPGVAAPIWIALATSLDGVWPRLVAIAQWPLSTWAPAAQSGLLVAGAGLAAFAALLVPFRGLRAAAGAMLIAIAAGAVVRPPQDDWILTVIDTGQGLAVVVETQRHVLVFDTGPRWRSGGTAASVSLSPYLRWRGIRRIDRLMISHADLDHAGGAELLQREFEVVRTFTSDPAQYPAPASACRRGDRWRWDGVEFRVLHPPEGALGSDNNRSCVLSIRGIGGSALLLADPESEAEQALLAAPLAADVVLLPHHGSNTSSTPELVAAVAARLGIASAGFGNRWGMPAAEVVARWRAAGTTVLQTAETGAVRVHFVARSQAMEVVTERGDSRHWWRVPEVG